MDNGTENSKSAAKKFLIALCNMHVRRKSSLPNALNDVLCNSVGEILEEAIRHKLLPLVANHALNTNLPLPRKSLDFLGNIVSLAEYRHHYLSKVAIEIQDRLRSNGVISLARKGAVYQSLLHAGNHVRQYSDLDFFVLPEAGATTEQLLASAGFIVGESDPRTRKRKDLSRRLLTIYRIYPDHIPTLVREENDPVVPCVEVDIAFNMLWYTCQDYRCGLKVLASAFSDPVREKGTGLLTLPNYVHFMDCCLHLFQDAYFEESIRSGTDVTLSAFLDAILLWQLLSADEVTMLVNSISEQGDVLAQAIAWVAFHIDGLFGTSVMNSLKLSRSIGDLPNTWQDSAGTIRRWRGTMSERLFAKRRYALFDGAGAW